MGRKAQISLLVVVMTAIVVAVGVYFWDKGSDDTIAEGVTIGGVDVGGLDREAAASQVRTNLITPVAKPVVVKYGDDQVYKLSPEKLNVHADVDGMVDAAYDASQEGGILGRSWRRISGGEVDEQIKPTISYSRKSVDEFIDTVAQNIHRDPVDASVRPTATSLEPIDSQTGLDVEKSTLRSDVERALTDPTDRTVEARADKIEPQVTTTDLAQKYPTYILVDRSDFQLRLYKDLKLEKSYTVAIGAQGFDTPTGLYAIQDKQVDPVWHVPDSAWAGSLAGTDVPPGPENPIKARWMGIYNGAGIHGTDDVASLGSAASHGCVRMAIPDVIDLFDRVDVGTPIYIS
jgi:lipoprotein-anchoring transpeptidase ErfK/SrfK